MPKQVRCIFLATVLNVIYSEFSLYNKKTLIFYQAGRQAPMLQITLNSQPCEAILFMHELLGLYDDKSYIVMYVII